jgi:nicotinamide-nucleotide amidase
MFLSPAAEIVTIGDELCRGEIVDTNSAWIAERLTAAGFHVRWRTSTTDEAADMEAALRQAAGRARVVVTSGGLGPTEDDRTVDVLCGLLGVAPAVDAASREKMELRFAERGFAITPNNLLQVRAPTGADVLENSAGLAPGFRVRLGGADVFVTPGVPREMKAIWDAPGGIDACLRAILDGAAGSRSGTAPRVARRVWRVAGLGESHVDHRLRGLLDATADATLHFRIAYPENLVTVVVRRPTLAEAERVLDDLDVDVRARLGDHVYGTGDESLAQVVGRMLRARGETLATAESCTGGLVGDLVTDVPGSSDYYRGGVVAYANDAKIGLLGVSLMTLGEHGAVSEACVTEMAEGVRRALGASWGVATSGIAGPGGGSDDKPVGLVHFAVAGPEVGGRPIVEARKLVWPVKGEGGRRMIKQIGAQATLFLLYRQLAALR